MNVKGIYARCSRCKSQQRLEVDDRNSADVVLYVQEPKGWRRLLAPIVNASGEEYVLICGDCYVLYVRGHEKFVTCFLAEHV